MYFATFPDLRSTADTGIIIGVSGLVVGMALSFYFGDYFGKVVPRVSPFNLKQGANYAVATGILALISLLSQETIILYVGSGVTQTTISAPSDPVGFVLFVEFMAVMESWFFVFFFFRLWRRLAFNQWWLGAIISSLIFGFVYHQFVYNNNPFLMTMAFIGGMIYCFALQWTHSFDVAVLLHVLQNFRVPSAQSVLTLLVKRSFEAIKKIGV